MKIRIPSTVPDECVPVDLSKGKKYELIPPFFSRVGIWVGIWVDGKEISGGHIVNDEGYELAVHIPESSHIGGHAWECLE